MKKIVGCLVLFLSISLIPANSATPPKAGFACPKQGIAETYQGKTYTCIKSGKKLVWSTGIVVKKPTLTPTPTGPSQPISLDNLDPIWTSKIAYLNVQKFALSQNAPNVKSELILSPTVKDRPYRTYTQGLVEITKILAPIFKNPNFSIVLFT